MNINTNETTPSQNAEFLDIDIEDAVFDENAETSEILGIPPLLRKINKIQTAEEMLTFLNDLSVNNVKTLHKNLTLPKDPNSKRRKGIIENQKLFGAKIQKLFGNRKVPGKNPRIIAVKNRNNLSYTIVGKDLDPDIRFKIRIDNNNNVKISCIFCVLVFGKYLGKI